jgi:hypothetical protein
MLRLRRRNTRLRRQDLRINPVQRLTGRGNAPLSHFQRNRIIASATSPTITRLRLDLGGATSAISVCASLNGEIVRS